jgi:hypothetical protein
MSKDEEAMAREAFREWVSIQTNGFLLLWDARKLAESAWLAAWNAARRDEDLAELKRLRLFRRFLETAASEDDTNEPLAVHEWIEMADEAVKQALALSEVKP